MNLEKPQSLLPNDRDIAFYRRHGWYVSPPVLSDEVLDAALLGCTRYYANDLDHKIPAAGKHFDWTPSRGERLRTNAYVSLQVNEVRELVTQEVIGGIAARLAETNCIRLFRDQLIWKPPISIGLDTLVGWHCDRAYWLTCTSDRMLTAWVPLYDSNETNGTLMVIDGSHRWPDNTAIRGFDSQDIGVSEPKFRTRGQAIVKVPLSLRRGQISFHHCKTIHGSMANRTDQPRIAFSIHLQAGENRYRSWRNSSGKPLLHLNDLLCCKNADGEPDYTDPEICPILWCKD